MTKEVIKVSNIEVVIYRKNVKNLYLRINKDKTISVSANNKVSIKQIEDFIKSKENWIKKGLNKIESYGNSNKSVMQYITGENIKIQDEMYKLLVIEEKINKVEIEENVIYLYTLDITDYKKKKSLIDKFLKIKAGELFEVSLKDMLELIKPYRVKRPEMQIRSMKSRWGSCNRGKKKITINLELIHMSKNCLDYVILHELIHFLVAAHNQSFYNYMTILMPDWKERKKILNSSNLI